MRKKIAIVGAVAAVGLSGAALLPTAVASAATSAHHGGNAGYGYGYGGYGGYGYGGFGIAFDGPAAAAAAIGISEDELVTAVYNGKTLTQIAAAHGISRQTLINRLVTAVGKALDTARSEGDLTASQVVTIKKSVKTRVTARVDGALGHGGRTHGGRGHWH